MENPSTARFGSYELNLGTGELRKSGVRVRLQEQPFQVLAALLERPGDLVSRDELHARLWPDAVAGDFEQGLNKAVNKVRSALSDSAENPRFVETLARRGYRFIAPVTFRDAHGAIVPGVERKIHVPEGPLGLAGDADVAPPPPHGGSNVFASEVSANEPPNLAQVLSVSRPHVQLERQEPDPNERGLQPVVVLPPTLLASPAPAGFWKGVLAWFALGVATPLLVIGGLLLAAVIAVQFLSHQGPPGPPRNPPPLHAGVGRVFSWDAASSRFLPFRPDLSGDGLSFSPDGNSIAFIEFPSAQLCVVNQDGTNLRRLAEGVFERTYTPQWSPAGNEIAFAARKLDSPWKVYVIRPDGTGLREVNPGPGTEADPSWSPDGRFLALAPFPWETQNSGTGVFQVEPENGRAQLVPGSRNYFSPRWSPDGSRLAALTEGTSLLALYSFETGAWTVVTPHPAMHPIWNRDGSAVYYFNPQDNAVFRYVLRDARPEKVASAAGMDLRSNSPFGDTPAPWVGLSPQDDVLLLQGANGQ